MDERFEYIEAEDWEVEDNIYQLKSDREWSVQVSLCGHAPAPDGLSESYFYFINHGGIGHSGAYSSLKEAQKKLISLCEESSLEQVDESYSGEKLGNWQGQL